MRSRTDEALGVALRFEKVDPHGGRVRPGLALLAGLPGVRERVGRVPAASALVAEEEAEALELSRASLGQDVGERTPFAGRVHGIGEGRERRCEGPPWLLGLLSLRLRLARLGTRSRLGDGHGR